MTRTEFSEKTYQDFQELRRQRKQIGLLVPFEAGRIPGDLFRQRPHLSRLSQTLHKTLELSRAQKSRQLSPSLLFLEKQ